MCQHCCRKTVSDTSVHLTARSFSANAAPCDPGDLNAAAADCACAHCSTSSSRVEGDRAKNGGGWRAARSLSIRASKSAS